MTRANDSRRARHVGRRGAIPAVALAAQCVGVIIASAALAAHTYTAMPPVAVSGVSPFTDCTADARAGQTFVPNSEFEPLIAVNPTNPTNFVGLWEQDRWLDGAAARGQVVGVSFDGGMSWESVVVPGLSICSGGTQYSADPWLSFAPNGDLYHIAYTYLEPPVEPGTRFGLLVNKSTDGGRSWTAPVTVNDAAYPALNNTPSITADPRDPNSVYAAWSQAEDTQVAFLGPALFSHSSDGGQSWDTPRVLYDPPSGSGAASPQIIVLPDGTLLNVFSEVTSATSRSLSIQRSTDGGATWLPDGSPIRAFSYRGISVVVPTAQFGLLTAGEPSIAVDRASGALYAAWQGGVQAKVVNFSMSTDGGLTWSAPIVVAKTPPNANARLTQSFLPAIQVARDGTVGVLYYDFRNDTPDASGLTDTWFTWCQPAQVDCTNAESWTGEVRLTPASFDLSTAPPVYGLFLGNHVGLASDGNDFLALFPQSGAADASSMYFVRIVPSQITCTGDCSNDAQVTVDELLTGVNIALGNLAISECAAFDSSRDGTVSVDEILTAVNAALNGCGGAAVWYVDERAPAGGDGRSWVFALQFVADALAAAHAGDAIHVAQGTYNPDRSAASPGSNGDRRATFQLRNGVELRGGYAGLGAADPDAIDLAVHPSTLSGDLAGDDGADFENNDENSLHVVTGSGVDRTAIIDGFTISGGNANGAAPYPDADQIGGGMLNWHDGSPTVVHCRFEGNSAQYAGGGMANGFDSSPKIADCSFIRNVTIAEIGDPASDTLDSSGGGIVNVAGSSPEITRCRLTQNRASGGAGILNELGAAPRVVECTFDGNATTIANGGGMYSLKEALPYIRDCIFRGNVSPHVGGALSFRSTPSDVWIINSLFDGNMCADGGGGVRAGNSSSVHVVNCTFVGNSANGSNPLFAGRAGGLDVGSDGRVSLRTSTIENSVFWGNTGGGQLRQLGLQGLFPAGLVVRYSDVQGGGSGVFVQSPRFPLTWDAGNIDADPLFVSAAAYDFRFTADSPCVGGGDPIAVPGDVTTDLAGNPRLADGGASVDMGPYQFAESP